MTAVPMPASTGGNTADRLVRDRLRAAQPLVDAKARIIGTQGGPHHGVAMSQADYDQRDPSLSNPFASGFFKSGDQQAAAAARHFPTAGGLPRLRGSTGQEVADFNAGGDQSNAPLSDVNGATMSTDHTPAGTTKNIYSQYGTGSSAPAGTRPVPDSLQERLGGPSPFDDTSSTPSSAFALPRSRPSSGDGVSDIPTGGIENANISAARFAAGASYSPTGDDPNQFMGDYRKIKAATTPGLPRPRPGANQTAATAPTGDEFGG